MKFWNLVLSAMIGGMVLFSPSCSTDYLEPGPVVSNPDGLRISMGGPLTRSANAETVLSEMRLYCFDRTTVGGTEPVVGTSSTYAPAGIANLATPYHHMVQGLTKTGMTLYTNQMRAGKWDLAMISPRGATLTAPLAARRADQLPMYTFNPDQNGGMAHEFYHSYCRLPEVTNNNQPYVNTSVSRNVAKVRVVVERVVDVQSSAPIGSHTITLDGIPQHISWAGTLLKSSSGSFVSDKDNFDVFPNGTAAFVKNVTFTPASETGTFKSDTLDYVIPAYRGTDFWVVNSGSNTLEMNPNPVDTIRRKMTLSVNFLKSSGGMFSKSVTIPRVAQCNKILLLKVRMSDASIEIKPDIMDWSSNDVIGNVEAAYLNVSRTAAEVYDGSVSRVYFWSNQPVDSVYITRAGKTSADVPIADINAIFDRLAGPSAANLHYDPIAKEGYVDINQINTSTVLATQTTKIYLNARGLKREIVVKRSVTSQAAKNLTTPYVGTFHKASQRGERLVTWSYSGNWNAVVEGPAKNDVLIDRQPSPFFGLGTLYGAAPGDAEQAEVSDWGGKITGKGRIYFRVGWKSRHFATEANPARYASIVVRDGLTAGSGNVIKVLYIRQGEGADYLMSPSDHSQAKRFSPYNVTAETAIDNQFVQLGVNEGGFTKYPSQAGALFQWANENNARYGYNPVGAVSAWQNNYPATFWNTLGAQHESCPSGYRRPNDGSTSAANATGAAANSEMRQSLWLTPPSGATPNTGNSNWGYYADGFFDRGAIVSSATSAVNSAVSSATSEVAYIGRLFFHPTTQASLFFPATGIRSDANGLLGSAGTEGGYWSSSSATTANAWNLSFTDSDAHQGNKTRSHALALRCVAGENATITFHPNGATGTVPTSITAKELSSIVIPGKGALVKGTEYFSGWNTAADGSGTQYPVGTNKMPIGGGNLYARWLYMEEFEEIVIPNSNLTGNVREIIIDVSGGHDNTFGIVNDGVKWFTATKLPGNKLRITANQSPNADPRESTITLAHSSDPNYKLVMKVSQYFYTDIPSFDYFYMKFNWTRNNDELDVAVEFNGNKTLSTGLPPAFDGKPVGFGFYNPDDVYGFLSSTHIEMNGTRRYISSSGAVSAAGLLYWGGDAVASGTSPEAVFFDAVKIDNATDLERYIKLDLYAIWWGAGGTPGKAIQLSISAFKGGTVNYNATKTNRQFTFTGSTTVYSETNYDIPIYKATSTNEKYLYDANRGFVNVYQKVATITYDRKSHKATIRWY